MMKGVVMVCVVFISAVRVQGQRSDFLHTDFSKADSVAALYGGHSLKDLRGLSQKLTNSLPTEAEKFRAIYRWVCANIDFDYNLYLLHSKEIGKKRTILELAAWNKKFTSRMFNVLLTKQKTVCTGYAYLVKELCSHAGIVCVIVDGYGRTAKANIRGEGIANHSWNAVQLNHKWYLCDPTWSSGAYDTEQMKYIAKYDDSYFLPYPSSFVRNHYPLDTSWMLVNDKPALTEFLNGPLVYSSALRYQLGQVSPNTFDIVTEKRKPVVFQFTASKEATLRSVELCHKGMRLAEKPDPQSKNGNYSVSYAFATKGTYIVHIVLNSDYAFSYVVTVK